MKILTNENIHSSASGKSILIGEHAVVYGYKALAMALPTMKLNITLFANEPEKTWLNAWHTLIQGKEVLMEERMNSLLTKAFENALKLVHFPFPLSQFSPQRILIDSLIPLGGGMGGSAAISTCLMLIASKLSRVTLTMEQLIQYSNEIDCLFHHGKASGLDVSAVASCGLIEFQKGKPIEQISHQCHFWFSLIDSGERSDTANMIKLVKENYEQNPMQYEEQFQRLNKLAMFGRECLEQGKTLQFASCLNEAQTCLETIGVSTLKINKLVDELKKQGALGAKLTGAGGGGLVLSVYEKEPYFLSERYGKDCVYLLEVGC